MTNKNDYVANFAKQILENTRFVGVYNGTETISSIQRSFQRVMIDKSETELLHNLQSVRRRIQAFYTQDYWVGFGNEGSNQILVENLNIIRGKYIFIIETVDFKDHEILLKLKVVQRLYDFTSMWYFVLTMAILFWFYSTFFIQVSYRIGSKICSCTYKVMCQILSIIKRWCTTKQ